MLGVLMLAVALLFVAFLVNRLEQARIQDVDHFQQAETPRRF
jgi:hypothetical protein